MDVRKIDGLPPEANAASEPSKAGPISVPNGPFLAPINQKNAGFSPPGPLLWYILQLDPPAPYGIYTRSHLPKTSAHASTQPISIWPRLHGRASCAGWSSLQNILKMGPWRAKTCNFWIYWVWEASIRDGNGFQHIRLVCCVGPRRESVGFPDIQKVEAMIFVILDLN